MPNINLLVPGQNEQHLWSPIPQPLNINIPVRQSQLGLTKVAQNRGIMLGSFLELACFVQDSVPLDLPFAGFALLGYFEFV